MKKRRVKKKDDCISRSRRVPRAIQRRVIQYINRMSNLYDGLLMVHGTGCGKTLAAVVASQCYLDKHPNNSVVFISPASLINNFREELAYYGASESKYTFFSFEKFYAAARRGQPIDCKNSLLIIDEAHNLRAPKSKRAHAILRCAYQAHKRLLLTATPFINSPGDFANLINMIHGKEIAGNTSSDAPFTISKTFTKSTMKSLTGLLRGRVDYEPSCRSSKEFPKVTETFVQVPMSKAYKNAYEAAVIGQAVGGLVMRNPRVFLHAYRKVVNKAGADKYYSEKLKKAISLIKSKGKIQKSMIFTNWIEFGVKAIEKYLAKRKISFRVFRGGLSAKTKKEIVDEFNADKFSVLIITRAGGEGLDLKKVRNVIILDPVWHDSGIQQIIGRAVRFRSHADLPATQRKVKVMKMVLTFPKPNPLGQISGDEMLYRIISKKALVKQKVDTILKDSSLKRARPQVIKHVARKSRRSRKSRNVKKRSVKVKPKKSRKKSRKKSFKI